jgi:peptidoglycan/xylan/chitin deacetylase (PgdA/CDA1 family)
MRIRVLAASILLGAGATGSLLGQAPQTAETAVAQKAGPASVSPDSRPVVALTFDDLPVAGALPQGDTRVKNAMALTAVLKANHLEGTYGMVNGAGMQNYPDAQQALHVWLDAGMNVGNHTWSHISLAKNTAEAFEQNIAQNEPVLAEYAQVRDWRWLRYPYLSEGDTLEKRRAVQSYLREHHYRVAQVTMSFGDYAWNDAYVRCSARQDQASIEWLRQSYLESAAEYIRLQREQERIAFGHEIPNVMLLHGMAFTTLMLPDLIDLLQKQGFRFASLAEVEQDPAYAGEPDAPLNGTLLDEYLDARHLPYPPFKPAPFDKLNSLCK